MSSVQHAFQLHSQGKLEQAAEIYAAIIKQQPRNFDAQQLMGVLRYQQGRNAESLVHLRAALKINAKDPAVLLNTGNTHAKLGNHRDALEHFDQALRLKPNYPEAHSNRGNALRKLERYTEALASFDKALQLRPAFPEALNGRGSALLGLNRLDDSLASFDKALTLLPQFAEALNNCGVTLQKMLRHAEAEACFQQAIRLRADYVDAYNNIGKLMMELQRTDEAMSALNKALDLDPDHIDARSNRATLNNNQSNFVEAIRDFEIILKTKPKYPQALPGYAFAVKSICDWAAVKTAHANVEKHVNDKSTVVTPLVSIAYGLSAAMLRKGATRFVEDECDNVFGKSWTPVPRPAAPTLLQQNQRLRIGYISTDFREHAVGYQIAELCDHHDKSKFEITGISLGSPDGSAMAARFEKQFDHTIQGSNLSDKAVAAKIQAQNIDLLVDLNGHTRGVRWGILALRPAPVQVSYLGFPGTTGAPFIDYVIADPVIAPFAHQPHFSEQIVQLPHTYMVNDRQLKIADTVPTRADAGLPEHGFVFCCFNTSYKITADVFDVWMRLLKAVDGSVLWLRRFNDITVANLSREATARGVNPQRLIFAGRADMPDHLARHQLADLFLDTLPFNGHSTACAALWSGLPVLTCLGETFAGRVGASLLGAIELPELIASSLSDYETTALQLAQQPSAIQAIKQRLAGNQLTTPLFDTPRFTRGLEAAYLTMWEMHLAGRKPQSFAVPPQ
jgi:protein O-GlcNAc transferase